jgi:hypothetical protein
VSTQTNIRGTDTCPAVSELANKRCRTKPPQPLWLAAAVRDNGGGTVIGTELVEHKAEQARAHVREAGLEEYVDIRYGDARGTLRDLPRPVDFLLNDG